VTVAGDTARDPGITVFGRETRIEQAQNVVVRHMRFRHGNKLDGGGGAGGEDALTPVNSIRVIIDHCSLSWGVDGTMDVWGCDRVTVQWCLISETLLNHSVACVARNVPPLAAGYVTFHHNLWAHHHERSPWIQDNMNAEVINEVVYNWRASGARIGSPINVLAPEKPFIGKVKANVRGCYFVAGPNTPNADPDNNPPVIPTRTITATWMRTRSMMADRCAC
jgi:pectate lyase